jgi:hypothetical protein
MHGLYQLFAKRVDNPLDAIISQKGDGAPRCKLRSTQQNKIMIFFLSNLYLYYGLAMNLSI